MSETITQANHELLLGVNRQLTQVGQQLTLISAQLQDQKAAEGGPRLGLCGECVAEWLQAGSPADNPNVAPALAWMPSRAGFPVPVCLRHFEAILKTLGGPQLLVAQPGMPQPPGTGLIVPGR